MSHDQKSCDIYKRFNWHKQTLTTLELQPHHTMRPLSVDKLNIVISRLHSGQTTCQISSSTGASIGTISKIYSEHFSDLPKSSGGYPVKLSPANVCHAVNFITSGKAETVGDPSKIRPYSSLTGLLLSLFSLTTFSFRKPKNKRKAE